MNTFRFVADDPGDVGEYLTSDGQVLKYRYWRPEGVPRAHVLALHGIQSHSGWYGYSSRAMADAGMAVRFLDRRGSGLNPRDSSHTATVDRLIDDVADFARLIDAERMSQSNEAPLILSGLSWGARLAAAVCDRHPDLFDGLILLYPGLCTHVRPSAAQRALLDLLRRIGVGRLPVSLPLRPEQFASKPRWQAFIREDPLALRRVSLSQLVAGEVLSRLALEALHRITLPRLVMLAGKDQIVDLPRTHELLNRIPAGSLCVIEYPGAQHTLEFESDRHRFVADMIAWIESIERD